MSATGRMGTVESRPGNVWLGETAPVVPTTNFLANWSAASPGIATAAQLAEFNRQTKAAPDRIQFVTSPTRQGNLSLKMTVEQGDLNEGSKERVQIATFNKTPSPQYYLRDGDDVWMAFSVWPDSNFYFPELGEFSVIMDGFPNSPDLEHSGVLATHEIGLGRTAGLPVWRLSINGGVSETGGSSYPHNTDQDVAPVVSGWNDFLLHIKMSTGNDGRVEVWFAPGNATSTLGTGAPNVSDYGPNVATANGYVLGMFPEPGIYRHTNAKTSSLYLGGFAINTSRASALAVLPEAHAPGSEAGELEVGVERYVVQPEVVTIP